MERDEFRAIAGRYFEWRMRQKGYLPLVATIQGEYADDGRTVLLGALLGRRPETPDRYRLSVVTALEDGPPELWLAHEVSRSTDVLYKPETGILVAHSVEARTATSENVFTDLTVSLKYPEIPSQLGGFALQITDVTLF